MGKEKQFELQLETEVRIGTYSDHPHISINLFRTCQQAKHKVIHLHCPDGTVLFIIIIDGCLISVFSHTTSDI